MNKARRHELKMLHYKKRIQRFVTRCNLWVNQQGEYVWHPKSIDLIKANAQHSYRSHSTPCSCYLCSHSKYNRAKEKSKFRKELN